MNIFDGGMKTSFINLHSVNNSILTTTAKRLNAIETTTNKDYKFLSIFSDEFGTANEEILHFNDTRIAISRLNVTVYPNEGRPSEWAILCGLVFGTLIMVLGIIGNAMTIAAYKRNRKLQTSFNFLITNLCVVDLLFSLLIIPLHLPFLIYKRQVMNHNACVAMGYFYYITLSSSVINLVCIAINRYVGIVKSKRYRLLFIRERKKWWIFAIWLTTPVLYMPFLFTGSINWRSTSLRCSLSITSFDGIVIKIYQVILDTTLQVIATVVLIVLYRAILKKVKRCRRSVENHVHTHTPSHGVSGGGNNVDVTVLKRPSSAPINICKCRSPKSTLLQVPQTTPVQRKYEMKTVKSDLSGEKERKQALKSEANSSPNLLLNFPTSPHPAALKQQAVVPRDVVKKHSYLSISLENNEPNNPRKAGIENTEPKIHVDRGSTVMPMFIGLGLGTTSGSKLSRENAIDEDDVEELDEYFVAKEICDNIEDDVFEDESTSPKNEKLGVHRLLESLTFDKSSMNSIKPKLNNNNTIPRNPPILSDEEIVKKNIDGRLKQRQKQSLFKKEWKRKMQTRYSRKNVKSLNKNGSAITIVVDQATSDADVSLMDYDNMVTRKVDTLEHVSEVTRESRPSTSLTDGSMLKFRCDDCDDHSENNRNFWEEILKKMKINKRKNDTQSDSTEQQTSAMTDNDIAPVIEVEAMTNVQINKFGSGKSKVDQNAETRSTNAMESNQASSPQYLMVGDKQGAFFSGNTSFDDAGNLNLSRRWSGQSDAISLYNGRRMSDAMRHDRSSVSNFGWGKNGSIEMKNTEKKPMRRKSIYQIWSSKKSSISSSICSNSTKRRRLAERRLAYSGIAICLAFAICVLPKSLISVLKGVFDLNISSNIKFAVALLSWVHAVLNPLLYGFLNPQYRMEYKKMIKDYWGKLTCKSDKILGPTTSSALAKTLRQQFR